MNIYSHLDTVVISCWLLQSDIRQNGDFSVVSLETACGTINYVQHQHQPGYINICGEFTDSQNMKVLFPNSEIYFSQKRLWKTWYWTIFIPSKLYTKEDRTKSWNYMIIKEDKKNLIHFSIIPININEIATIEDPWEFFNLSYMFRSWLHH